MSNTSFPFITLCESFITRTMKLTSYIIALSTLLFASCGGKDSDNTPGGGGGTESTLSVSPSEQTVSGAAGTVQIKITASTVPAVASDASWCSVKNRDLSGTTYTYTFNIEANPSTDDRVATITVSAGSSSKKVFVKQLCAEGLLVEKTSYEIGADGGSIDVKLKATGVATVQSSATWLTAAVPTTKAMADYVCVITAQPNSSVERSGTVALTVGNITENITVKQAKGYTRVVISPDVKYQTIEGFAASDCWSAAVIGKYWTSKRSGMAELLFSREIADGQPKGIGLSMWRTNLGAGSAEQGLASKIGVDGGKDAYEYYRRAESYLNDDLSYDWTRCEGQRFFLDEAKRYGVESIVLFSNSPNVQFTKNGLATNIGNGFKTNLKDECYDDFAQYMARVAKQYKAWGYPVTHISPVNEPQYDWAGEAQEGCTWANSEIANLTRELDKALDDEGVDAKILIAEASSWDCVYKKVNAGNVNPKSTNAIAELFQSASDNYVGDLKHIAKVFGAHSYWTDGTWDGMRNERQQAASAAQAAGIGLWQTEWSMLGDGYSGSEFMGYDMATELDIALYMDKVIHNDLTVANVSSWSFWTSMDVTRWSQKDRFMLINFVPSGGEYSVDLSGEGKYNPYPTLWVLGNYSRFIRPGYVRINTDYPESRTLFSSAYASPDGKQIVVVYSNLSGQAEVVGLSTSNKWSPISVKTYTTSKGKNLFEATVDIAVPITLEPNSVTTVVYQL